MTNLTQLICCWLNSGDSGRLPLIDVVNLAINDSKAKIRVKLQELAKRKRFPNLDASISHATALLSESVSLVQEGDGYLKLVGENMAPALLLQLRVLTSKLENLEMMEAQMRKAKVLVADDDDASRTGVVNFASVENMEGLETEKNSKAILQPFDDRLLEARSIICSDLSSTSDVTLKPFEFPEDADYDEMLEELADFTSSQFAVSNFIPALEGFLYSLLGEDVSSDSKLSVQLYLAARKIMLLYMQVAPVKHRKLIELSPQCNAIFYNNCIYLSHSLEKLNEKCLEKCSKEVIVTETSLMDLRPRLHRLAADSLKHQKKIQRVIIIDFFQQPHVLQSLIDNTATDDRILHPFELATRQSLAHLMTIKKFWSSILSQRIFNKVMGELLETLLSEFIHRIVSLEDISAKSANKIAAIMDGVIKQWKEIFHELDEDLSGLAPKCFAFTELKFVLTANLREIVDRWSDGYGPLATAFPVESVKRLIRALFQNSEKRAQALSLIK